MPQVISTQYVSPVSSRIGVLHGGKSPERTGSLKSGQTVIASLKQQGYDAVGIDPQEVNIGKVAGEVDILFNALHGLHGEDGTIQGFLETCQLPYTGCGVTSSAIGMNKLLFKKLLEAEGIPTPRYIELGDLGGVDIKILVRHLVESLGLPIVVKPVSQGGSLGIHICPDEVTLGSILVQDDGQFGRLFAEKFIVGDFITFGLLGKLGTPEPLGMIRAEFDQEDFEFYDYVTKHTAGAARYVDPTDLPKETRQTLQQHACRIYTLLGCHSAVRVDFMVARDGTGYVLEINTSPGMSPIGNLPTIARNVGINYNELVARILQSAYDRADG